MVRPRTDRPADDTHMPPRSRSPRPIGAVVRVLGAPAAPPRFRLTAGQCILGAGAGADVVIQHETVSRTHVGLELVPEGVAVSDLGSRNGTFYLGQRLEKMVLALGSRIRLGTTVEAAIDIDTESLATAPAEGSPHRMLLGASPSMQRLFAILARLEGSLVSVLVEGESGSGKELIAQAIHQGSMVSQGPIVVVNCGAIARELVLSELFGHKRGAFTGALVDRVGAFEAAHGGTLFLDEIGELPLEAQPALLRALETGDVSPVGETQPRRVKVRIVAATNRDLEEEVRAGRFREDLYYRLAVVKLTVPPLRERPEDIPLLASHFAAAAGLPSLPDDVLARFAGQSWPGNVRELRNAVDAYIAIGTLPGGERAGEGELEAAIRKLVDVRAPYADLKEAFLHRFTRTYLTMLLAETGATSPKRRASPGWIAVTSDACWSATA